MVKFNTADKIALLFIVSLVIISITVGFAVNFLYDLLMRLV